jgi:hypothetical protein
MSLPMLPSVGKLGSRGSVGLNHMRYSRRDRRRAAAAEIRAWSIKLARSQGQTGPEETFRFSPEDVALGEIAAARIRAKWGLL